MFELDTAAGVKIRRAFASSSVPGAVDQPAQITSCVGHRERMNGKGVCFLAVVCVPLSCLQSRPKIQATTNRCNFAYRRTALSYLVMLVKFCSGNRFSYLSACRCPLYCGTIPGTWQNTKYKYVYAIIPGIGIHLIKSFRVLCPSALILFCMPGTYHP